MTEVKYFVFGFLVATFMYMYLIPLLDRRKQEKESNDVMTEGMLVDARFLMVYNLNHTLAYGGSITVSKLKDIKETTIEAYPDVIIDYGVMAGEFEVSLKLGKRELTIEGLCDVPESYLVNNQHYTIY